MKNYIIAWKNLWRNRRRTLITVASVFFGVLLAAIMSSMQEGTYENMIDNVVKFYSGYIQVQDKEYWEHKTLYYSFEDTDSLHSVVDTLDQITQIAPRLESYALMSSEDVTQPAMVIGVDAQKEDKFTNLSRWVARGKYLDSDPNGILLAEKLAKNLDVSLNDTIALLGQGYYGNTVAAEFVVFGILSFPNPEMNKQFSYLPLESAQQFFSAYGKLTSLALMLDDHRSMHHTLQQLEAKLDSPYLAMSWREMQPEMVQMIESDRAGGVIMKAILYIVIGFGILGTIMMMVAERRKEMGLMVAVGMQKHKLAGILFFETLYIGLIGVIAGILISLPIIFYIIHHPIPITGDAAKAMTDMGIEPEMVFTATPKVFINQLITVLGITVLAAIYPLVTIFQMKEINYLKD